MSSGTHTLGFTASFCAASAISPVCLSTLKSSVLKELSWVNVFIKTRRSGCGRYLVPDDGQDRCLMCLGTKHTEAAFVEESCSHCGRMTVGELRTRLGFLQRGGVPVPLPRSSVPPSKCQEGSTSCRELSGLTVTVRNSPKTRVPPSNSTSQPVELPKEQAGPPRGVPLVYFWGSPRQSDVICGIGGAPELTGTWTAPFTARNSSSGTSSLTTLDGGPARGYTTVPPVERAVAMQLCPGAAWHSLALIGSAYAAYGEAGSALHAMALLQVHQAKALKVLYGGGHDPEVLKAVRIATDLTLRVTKVTAWSLGRAMSTMVVQEHHLWLCLADMRETDKTSFLNASVSQTGLFDDTVENFSQQFSAAQKQTEAIRHILPWRAAAACLSLGAAPCLRANLRPANTDTLTPLWTSIEMPKQGPCIPHRCPTVGMSVVPLVLLVHYLGAWIELPSPSCWLLQTIRLGYAIQFTQRPPKFRGIHFTSVKAADAHLACRNRNFTGEGCDRAGPSSRL
ncbi:Acetyl-coenzyme A carboxylase carboxyl transferase subunit beta [Labeo rohita]|uniref:Acetyl-coenzyme A carboxylase carboxyl transferase subunit beta n=1 Tax=Labeo rohita TaxID=84645 RepID=A0ABQ8LYX8_LABRO|nr:Acetyl-coenzyme A carboxylase carboxyl transferase subunit beta [Labeo rohita]